MFGPIPLTPMLLNPDDAQDWDSSQDYGQDDHTDVNTSNNPDDQNGDRNAIDDYYGNTDESSYNIDQGDYSGYNNYSQSDSYYDGNDDTSYHQVLNSSQTIHNQQDHYLVQPDNNYQSTDGYSDPQPEGIDY